MVSDLFFPLPTSSWGSGEFYIQTSDSHGVWPDVFGTQLESYVSMLAYVKFNSSPLGTGVTFYHVYKISFFLGVREAPASLRLCLFAVYLSFFLSPQYRSSIHSFVSFLITFC